MVMWVGGFQVSGQTAIKRLIIFCAVCSALQCSKTLAGVVYKRIEVA